MKVSEGQVDEALVVAADASSPPPHDPKAHFLFLISFFFNAHPNGAEERSSTRKQL
jgi:hypothetical protein